MDLGKMNPFKEGMKLFENIQKNIPKGIPNLPKLDLNILKGNPQMFVNEVETATIEHLRLAVKQTLKIHEIVNRTTKNIMRTYAPDFVYPFYEQVDDFIKPYTGTNLQKTFTTQYESAFSWVKSVSPKPTHQLIHMLDKWVGPFKFEY